MSKNKMILLVIGLVLIIVFSVGLMMYDSNQSKQPGPLDAFASCLKDKGAIFYGAFWCPHCKNQKALFGNSARLLPYVECSTPDGASQNQVCTDKKVSGYPTWEFSDQSRESGELSLSKLAEKTGCTLPAGF